MTDLEHDLAAAADGLRVGSGDVDAVMSRGRDRRNRRQRLVGGVTAIALVAATATILNADSEGGTPVATLPALERGEVALHWEVESTTDGLGMAGSGVNGAGPFYALSTAAGRADVNKSQPSRVVWRSSDGVDWTAASTLGKDLYLSDLSPTDGRVYAVGTAPAQAGTKRRGDLVAGWSDDGGKTFSKTALPVDWAGLESRSTSVSLLDTQIASTGKGTVVTAIVRAALDVPRLLPSGVSAPDGWATTATGVDILGPQKSEPYCPEGMTSQEEARAKKMDEVRRLGVEGGEEQEPPRSREVEPGWCFSSKESERGVDDSVTVSPQDMRGVVRSLTWADLGVEGDTLTAARKQVFGFFAPANTTEFSRIDLGDVRSDAVFLSADDDAFQLFNSGVMQGQRTSESTDLRSDDGRQWTANAGPGDLRWVTAAGNVAGRRIVVGEGTTGSVIARADGNGGWTMTPLSSVVDPAVTGGQPVYGLAAGIGGLGVVVAVMPAGDDDAKEPRPTRLVYSRDGVTFDDAPVDEIAGRKVGSPLRIVVSGMRAVVAFSGGSSPDDETPKPQTILVATPA